MLIRACLAIIAALTIAGGVASAQSLADVARQEEARRNGIRKTSKRFTNADLRPDTHMPTIPAPAVANAAPAGAVATADTGNTSPSTATQAEAPAAEPVPPLNEARWRDRAAGLKASLERARGGVAALSGAAHADPRIQARAEKLLQQAREVLASVEAQQKEFDAEAAALKVPLHWIQ